MNTVEQSRRSWIAASCLAIASALAPENGGAAVQYFSAASITSDGLVRLQAVTFNTSPRDREFVSSMGARGNPFTGPGYNAPGGWSDFPLDADLVAAIAERFDSAPGQHCVTGQHRWSVGNVVNLRSSARKCVTKSGGGGGGGCAVVNPQVSLLSIEGERTLLPSTASNALTNLGRAEDGRSIVLDNFTLRRLASSVESQEATVWHIPDSSTSSAREVDGIDRSAAVPINLTLVVHHQGEHVPNANFAPIPAIAFSPQPYSGEVSGRVRRGFAIVDIGESGRARAVQLAPAPSDSEAVSSAIARALTTRFPDDRRHDHRVYVAYEINHGLLRMVGSPFVTMPQCCISPPPPCQNPPCPIP